MADLPPSDPISSSLPTSLPIPPAGGSAGVPLSPPNLPPPSLPEEEGTDSRNSLAAYSPLNVLRRGNHIPASVPPPVIPQPEVAPKLTIQSPTLPKLPVAEPGGDLKKSDSPPISPRLTPPPFGQPVSPVSPVSPLVPPVTSAVPLSKPVSPATVSSTPGHPSFDREELLKQASEAPEHTFILPSLATEQPDETLPPLKHKREPLEPLRTPEVIQPVPPLPTSSLPTPQPILPPVQPPIRPRPIPPQPVTIIPDPVSLPKHVPPKPVLPDTKAKTEDFPFGGRNQEKHAHVIFGIIGGVIALIALVAGLYVLADNGTRIPVLYSALSGLSPSGLTASSQAITKNNAHTTYQYQSVVSVVQQGSSSSSSTVSGSSSGTSPVYQLNASVSTGQVTNTNQTNSSYIEVAANGNSAVPVVIRTTTGATTAAYFPAGTSNATLAITSANLSNTLLEPALSPLTIDTLLKSVQTETAYQKQALSSNPIASYTVKYGCSGLASIFPTGATLSNCGGTVSFYWKTPTASLAGLPAASTVNVTFTYKGETYAYQAQYRYSNWGQAINGTNSGDVVLINNVDLSSLTATDVSDFVSSLGISFADLAHDSSLDSGTSQIPITPTGLSTTQVQSPLATVPPIPVQPATAAALQRDMQRKHDLQDLQSALEAYKKDHGSYPASSLNGDQVDASQALFDALVPKYLTAMPEDPLKDTYYYLYISPSSGSGTYHLRSVLENASDPSGVVGAMYTYFDLYNP